MDRVKAVSCALEGLGVKPGGRVALLSENRPEWPIVDFACQCYGAVLVPIFPTMVAEQVAYLLKDSGATVAFASTPEQATKVLGARRGVPRGEAALKHVVVLRRRRTLAGIDALRDRPREGAAPRTRPTRPRSRSAPTRASRPTSRRSSTPPARRASRRARCSRRATSSRTSSRLLDPAFDVRRQSRSRSSRSRTSSSACSSTLLPSRRATIAYAESIDKLRDNLARGEPALFGAVPRVYEKIYARVQENLSKSSPGQARSSSRRRSTVGQEGHRAQGAEEAAGLRASRSSTSSSRRLVYRKVRGGASARGSGSRSRAARRSRESSPSSSGRSASRSTRGTGSRRRARSSPCNCPSAWRLGTVGRGSCPASSAASRRTARSSRAGRTS